MSEKFTFRKTTSTLILACLMSTLSGCGGGDSNDAAAPPSSQKPPTSISDNVRGQSSDRFVATVNTQQNFATRENTSTLLIVDTKTNQVVKQISLSTTNGGEQWHIFHNYTINLSTGDFSMKGQRAVYYLDKGKVFRIDLHLDTLPAPQQVSNTSDACHIREREVYDIDFEVLTIQTVGPDEDCSKASYFNAVQITSAMPSWQSAPSINNKVVGAIYAADESMTAKSTLVFDMVNKLWAYGKDVQLPLYEIKAPEGLLSMSKSIDLHFNAKLKTHFLQVGDAVYSTKFVGGQLQLGERLVSKTGVQLVKDVFAQPDQTVILFNDGSIERASSGDSASTEFVAMLPEGMDPIDDWLRQDNSLVVVTENPSTRNKTYYRVNSTLLRLEKLGVYTYTAGDQGVYLQGEDLIILRGKTAFSETKDLLQYSLQKDSFKTHLTNIIPVGVIASISNLKRTWEQLAYCQPLASRKDCAGAEIRLRDMMTANEVALGSYTADPSWLYAGANIDELYSASSRIVLKTFNRINANVLSNETWTFDPKQPNSLQRTTSPN